MGWIVSAVTATIAFFNRRDALRYRELEHPRPATRSYRIGAQGEHAVLECRILNDERGNWRVAKVSVASPGHARLSLAGEVAADDGAGNITDFKPQGSWTQNLTMPRGDNGIILVTPLDEDVELLFTFASRTINPFTTQAKLFLSRLR